MTEPGAPRLSASELTQVFRAEYGRAVAVLLFAMSVSSWVVILWKGWLLRRARLDIQRGVAAFWSAANVAGKVIDYYRSWDIEVVRAVVDIELGNILNANWTNLADSRRVVAVLSRKGKQ